MGGAARHGRALELGPQARFRRLVGVGGIGTGLLFALDGSHDLGRNESRPARLLDVRDYGKLHIVAHYPATLLGARPEGAPFHVLPVGKVGRDDAGRRLVREMEEAGMDTRLVEAAPGHPTLLSVCFQYPDGAGGNITTSDSAAALLAPRDVDAARPWLGRDTVVLAAPEVSLDARRHLLRQGTEHGAFRAAAFTTEEIAEAKALRLFADVDLVALNEDEATALVGSPLPVGSPESFLGRCAETLGAFQPKALVLVTAGRRGVFAFESGAWQHRPAWPVPVASTAGAGDALLGGVLTGLAAGLPFTTPGDPARAEGPLSSAVDLGALLAAFKVTSPHTIPPGLSLDALLSFARAHGIGFRGDLARLLSLDAGGGRPA